MQGVKPQESIIFLLDDQSLKVMAGGRRRLELGFDPEIFVVDRLQQPGRPVAVADPQVMRQAGRNRNQCVGPVETQGRLAVGIEDSPGGSGCGRRRVEVVR